MRPLDAEDLPLCVLTLRKTQGGIEVLDAIVQSDEMEAHDVAAALCRTGQPTWLLTLSEMERHRYWPGDLDDDDLSDDDSTAGARGTDG